MDKEKIMRLTIAGAEIEASPQNTSLFSFMGAMASRDHIFVHDPENKTGIYIFSFHTAFDRIRQHMIDNAYPMHINMVQVAEIDENAYTKAIEQTSESEAAEMGDTIPDDWE